MTAFSLARKRCRALSKEAVARIPEAHLRAPQLPLPRQKCAGWEVGRGRIAREEAVLVKVTDADLGFSTIRKRWVLSNLEMASHHDPGDMNQVGTQTQSDRPTPSLSLLGQQTGVSG